MMTLTLFDQFKPYLIESDGESRFVYRFPNQYVASVVRSAATWGGLYGLWEVKVLHGNFSEVRDTYGLPFIFGYNTIPEVLGLLEQIRSIPMAWQNPHDKKTQLRLLNWFRR